MRVSHSNLRQTTRAANAALAAAISMRDLVPCHNNSECLVYYGVTI